MDLSADYCRLARWRATDPGERAKAMQVPKPPPVPDAQDALFEVAMLDAYDRAHDQYNRRNR